MFYTHFTKDKVMKRDLPQACKVLRQNIKKWLKYFRKVAEIMAYSMQV